jgi:general transcription factor 3C polypeptide 5 (transcription factor C subunit 1)
MSLLNQFTAADARDIRKCVHLIPSPVVTGRKLSSYSSKVLLPLVCYVFQDGPWRDTLVKFGYDPRKDANARLYVFNVAASPYLTFLTYASYQRLYFRNPNHPIARPSVTTRRQNRSGAHELTRSFSGESENDARR